MMGVMKGQSPEGEGAVQAKRPAVVSSPDKSRGFAILATVLLTLVIAMLAFVSWREFGQADNALADSLFVLFLIPFPVVGWLIAVRQTDNPLGWIYLVFPFVIGAGVMLDEIAVLRARSGPEPAVALLLISGSWITFLGYWLLIGPGIGLFPDGRLFNRQFRRMMQGLVVLVILWSAVLALGVDRLCLAPFGESPDPCVQTVENPLAFSNLWNLDQPATDRVVEIIFFLSIGVSFASVIARYRRSSGDVRQQIKWVAWMAVVSFFFVFGMYAINDLLGWIDPAWGNLISIAPVMVGLPASIGIAIFRYHLYDIDRVISRTLSYSLLTGALLAIYFAGVALLQTFLPTDSPVAVVVSTLGSAALFNPLRLRFQDGIDRRFFRRKYDSEKILADFASRTRDEVNPDTLAGEVLRTAREALQPASASLWMRGSKTRLQP